MTQQDSDRFGKAILTLILLMASLFFAGLSPVMAQEKGSLVDRLSQSPSSQKSRPLGSAHLCRSLPSGSIASPLHSRRSSPELPRLQL
jgi:hypothetical protein